MKDVIMYGEVGSEIDSSWLNHEFNNIVDHDVTLRVNSPGGDVFEGVAISNTIRNAIANGKHVTVEIDGIAASAASYMGLAANRVVMNPGSSMMIHDPFAFCVGNSTELKKTAAALDKTRDSIIDLYVRKTGRTPQEIAKAMADETWFTATEAVEWGLADEVGDPVDMPDVETVNAKYSTRSDLLRDRLRAAKKHEEKALGYKKSTMPVDENTGSEDASIPEQGEAPRWFSDGWNVYQIVEGTKHERLPRTTQ